MKSSDSPHAHLPHLPGVYIFKNLENQILYVGKAKDIKRRVGSYFRKQVSDWKIDALIKEHALIEHIVTQNELEALLLEAQLIKKYQPKYNVLLKSGNPFVYLLFTDTEPKLLKIVRIKKEKGSYFGPFIHKNDARRCFEYLTRTFKLQLCTSKIKGGCLNYHLNKCAGNCAADFQQKDYDARLDLAKLFLEGDYQKTIASLEILLQEYNSRYEFEKARNIADYITHINVIFATLKSRFTERKYTPEITQALLPKFNQADYAKGFYELKDLLHLPELPHSIDCFDISHFQSVALVGSCIRFTDGKPDKNKFRRFAIKTLTEQNDYAALHEVVSRRYKADDFPDVILIDGGKGQLNAVKNIFPDRIFISLAKREERLYTPGHPEGIVLDLHTELGKLLVAMRDYAHHFAVSYHTLKRSKKIFDMSYSKIDSE
jgi:excinuclease ABC subunit C